HEPQPHASSPRFGPRAFWNMIRRSRHGFAERPGPDQVRDHAIQKQAHVTDPIDAITLSAASGSASA
ncbi:MAG TPA: hypothetical protein VHN20_06550, partial [Beijerinckiaceae bacterium]|nr:hypothetical protein [Beijerinckiaceae bacterium]